MRKWVTKCSIDDLAHKPMECEENKTYRPIAYTKCIKRREWAFSRSHCEHSWVERMD